MKQIMFVTNAKDGLATYLYELSSSIGKPLSREVSQKILFVFFLLSFGESSFANAYKVLNENTQPEEPETPAQLIADGTYYIYNTEAQAYLSNGANWGTRSVLADQGIAYGVSCNVENGKYTLKSGIKGDAKALRPSDGFNDQSGEWEIKETEGGFALFNGEKYFSHVEGSMVPGYTDDITAGSVWTFVTAESRKALLSDATAENPVDATVYIKAPDFLNGDVANAAWEGNKVGGDAGSGNTLINNTNCEKWNAGSFTVSQTITDIPNGIYKLTAQAYYRHGGTGAKVDENGEVTTPSAAEAFEAGEEVLPTLFANDNKVTIKSIFSEAKEAAEGGWAVVSGAYYIPNSQAQAAACFETGAYLNTIENIKVTDNTLTIGVTREGEQEEDWTVFDTFRLTYFGENTDNIEDPEQPKYVQTPSIIYENNKIRFSCGTENVVYHCTYSISTTENGKTTIDSNGVLDMPSISSCDLTISVYATASGYNRSKTATKTFKNIPVINNGDVNNDGDVNIADITKLINIILGKDSSHDEEHEYVDLGLPSGTLWATMNVGAESPEDYGNYYAWGETKAYGEEDTSNAHNYSYNGNSSYKKTYYDWSTYKWCNGSSDSQTKYNTNSSCGTVDNKKTLELADDVAYVNWGENWRMPTHAEMQELKNNCTWTWTSINGKNGYKVSSKKDKFKYIFLPAAGYRYYGSLDGVGSYGFYWSSSLDESYPYYAWYLLFYSGGIGPGSNINRYNGQSVRPVRRQ